MNGVAMLTGLLSHENNDIAGAAIVLLRDLTESDAFTEHPSAAALLDVLLQPAHLEPIVANLERMDESYPDDAQCVFNTFTIFENICEVRPESVAALTCDFAAAQSAVSDTTSPLFRFLLKRIRYTKHDQNRLYASEILAILLGNEVSDAQSSAGNARAVFAAPPLLGLVQLLAALEAYSGVDIRSAEEEEFVRNLFDALCSALLHTPNRLALVPNMTAEADPEAIALQLMSAMNILTALLRKDLTRPLALRALDFALVRCDANCEAFVEAGGLKTLFAVFMLASKRKLSECQHEEHLMSIVAQLLSLTTEGRFERALGKFTENNNAKVERLVEYRDSYARRLDESDSRQRRAAENDESEQESEDEKYLRHTDCGLYTLQLTDLVLGLISTAGDAALRDRVEELLNQKDYSLDDVKTSLQAFAKHVDDGEQKVLVQKIAALL
jgi:beta-catenin-like protein 1